MGLVNMSVNPHYRDLICQQLNLILPLLKSRDSETLISTLTLLYYLQLVSFFLTESLISTLTLLYYLQLVCFF